MNLFPSSERDFFMGKIDEKDVLHHDCFGYSSVQRRRTKCIHIPEEKAVQEETTPQYAP